MPEAASADQRVSFARRAGRTASRLLEHSLERPLPLIVLYLAVGSILLFATVGRYAERIRDATVLQSAETLSFAVAEFRDFYASELVARAAGSDASHDHMQDTTGLPLPITLTMELGKHLSERESGASFGIFSAYPFPVRNERVLDAFEQEALVALAADPANPYVRFGEVNGKQVLRHAAAIRMVENCVACHNSHPESPKLDWKIGDVRGAQQVIVPVTAIGALTIEQFLEPTMLIGGVLGFGTLLVILLVSRLRRSAEESRRLAALTEERNAELIKATTVAEQASRSKSEFLANMSH